MREITVKIYKFNEFDKKGTMVVLRGIPGSGKSTFQVVSLFRKRN